MLISQYRLESQKVIRAYHMTIERTYYTMAKRVIFWAFLEPWNSIMISINRDQIADIIFNSAQLSHSLFELNNPFQTDSMYNDCWLTIIPPIYRENVSLSGCLKTCWSFIPSIWSSSTMTSFFSMKRLIIPSSDMIVPKPTRLGPSNLTSSARKPSVPRPRNVINNPTDPIRTPT